MGEWRKTEPERFAPPRRGGRDRTRRVPGFPLRGKWWPTPARTMRGWRTPAFRRAGWQAKNCMTGMDGTNCRHHPSKFKPFSDRSDGRPLTWKKFMTRHAPCAGSCPPRDLRGLQGARTKSRGAPPTVAIRDASKATTDTNAPNWSPEPLSKAARPPACNSATPAGPSSDAAREDRRGKRTRS